jgi:PHD/YefM family antitoxin component YafN of YafNO toxin-antitoxin module
MAHSTETGTPLADFARDAEAAVRRLKDTGEPEVLTVDGEDAAVIMDVRAYQRLLDRLDYLETVKAIREALAEVARGEDVPFEEVEAELRAKYGLTADE